MNHYDVHCDNDFIVSPSDSDSASVGLSVTLLVDVRDHKSTSKHLVRSPSLAENTSGTGGWNSRTIEITVSHRSHHLRRL